MTLSEVESRLRAAHRPGEKSYLLLDIDEVGNICYTVQRMTGAMIHIGSSLVNPENALFAANDSLANADMHAAMEQVLVRNP